MDPKMEGVEKRLSESHPDIEPADTSKERTQTTIADISGIEANVTPPRSLIKVLEAREGFQCGQAYEVTWQDGPWKGNSATTFCAEPLCRETGACTGTRFVPHHLQWTSKDPSTRQPRTMTPKEIVAVVRMAAKQAAAQTGRDEDRSDTEILAHVKMVWQKTVAAIRGKDGQWRR